MPPAPPKSAKVRPQKCMCCAACYTRPGKHGYRQDSRHGVCNCAALQLENSMRTVYLSLHGCKKTAAVEEKHCMCLFAVRSSRQRCAWHAGLTLSSCFCPGGNKPCSGSHLKYAQSAAATASPGALICHSAGTSLLLCMSTIITCRKILSDFASNCMSHTLCFEA